MVGKASILGFGEVGKAIAKFYNNPAIKDLDRNDGLQGSEVLNVCIPYKGEDFIEIVKKEVGVISPKLIIVHSTVAPGTTKKIADETGVMAVHSPVRGVHPNLFEGVKTFVKYIGADSEEAGSAAKKHLEDLGIKAKVFMPSKTTELGKLFSTTYYGLCIAYHAEMKKICDEEGIDFEKAVTDFNQTYNEGYSKLGKLNVIRPVLYPPQDGIGGHCVCENAGILKKFYQSDVFDFILKHKPKDKHLD
jgi:UDP-N-acetyl-D-mannosaminuronate dehydrogenase